MEHDRPHTDMVSNMRHRG